MRNCILISFSVIKLFILTSCSEEESVSFSTGFDAPVVYGYICKDFMGVSQEVVGSPNIRTTDPERKIINNTGFFNITSINIYPNPTRSLLMMSFYAEEGAIKKVYFVPARNSLTYINPYYNHFNTILLYTNGLPVFEFISNGVEIPVDCSEFEEGFYRVYVQIGDILLFDNLLITSNEF